MNTTKNIRLAIAIILVLGISIGSTQNSLSASSVDGLTLYSTRELNRFWDNAIGDDSFDPEWYEHLGDWDTVLVATEDESEEVCGPPDIGGGVGPVIPGSGPPGSGPPEPGPPEPGPPEPGLPSPIQGCEVGEARDIEALLFFPVRNMPLSARTEIFRRKAVLNIYLNRAQKHKGSGVCKAPGGSDFENLCEMTATDFETLPAQTQAIVKRGRSAAAELFLLYLLQYLNEPSLSAKCNYLTKAKNVLLAGSISSATISSEQLSADYFVNPELAEIFELVRTNFEPDVTRHLACSVKPFASREQLKQRIREKVATDLYQALDDEFDAISDLMEDAADDLIDQTTIQASIGNLPTSDLSTLRRQVTDGLSLMNMVEGDALRWNDEIRPSLQGIEWDKVEELNLEVPEQLTTLDSTLSTFRTRVIAGLTELQELDLLLHGGLPQCEGLTDSFSDVMDDVMDQEIFAVAWELHWSAEDYRTCLASIRTSLRNSPSSTGDSRLTAALAANVSELAYCVAQKKRNPDAVCIKPTLISDEGE